MDGDNGNADGVDGKHDSATEKCNSDDGEVVAAPDEKRRQTRDDSRQVSAVAMMKAECSSCGSRQSVKGDKRGQQRRR